MIKKIAATAALFIIVGLGIWGITQHSDDASSTTGLRVTASFYPLYDFAKQVGGDKIHVTTMTPAGAEPHDFEPTPKDMAAASTSRVFIYNGGQFEPWVDKFIKNYRGVGVKATAHIPLRAAVPAEGHAAEDHGTDPHAWLDPVLAQRMVTTIEDGLSKADPANAAYYNQNAADYIKKLQDLDQAYRQGLTRCQLRTIITSHQSTGYLAARYNITVEAIAGLSPEAEPSAARLAEISQIVAEKDIRYIFFESLVSPRLAATIASETGAQTLVLDPLEGVTDEDQKSGKDYLSIQRENLGNLRRALACQ